MDIDLFTVSFNLYLRNNLHDIPLEQNQNTFLVLQYALLNLKKKNIFYIEWIQHQSINHHVRVLLHYEEHVHNNFL
jgi:hypothetical protein